jgi:hypothetical protein
MNPATEAARVSNREISVHSVHPLDEGADGVHEFASLPAADKLLGCREAGLFKCGAGVFESSQALPNNDLKFL